MIQWVINTLQSNSSWLYLQQVNTKFLNLVNKINQLFATVKDITDNKKFFETIQIHGNYIRILTAMKKSELTTSRSVLIGLPERQLFNLLEIK